MKKCISQWLLLAVLLLSFQTAFVSCSDNADDNRTQVTVPEGQGFFSAEINQLIDDNYPQVMQNGYAELVIPATMFDHSIMQYADYHNGVMSALNALGYKTFINGGAVRDAILGTPIHDLDFSTDATPEQMKALLTGYEVVITTTGGGDIAQALYSNGDWTDMVPMHGVNEQLRGKAFIPANATYGAYSTSLLDDTFGRDLTINAVYYDYQTGNIIDYHGGLHDLREHIIRTVYDADAMYPVNPSALIRTVRFAARYGFDIDQNTAESIARHMHYCEEKIAGPLNNYYVLKGFGDGCPSRTYQYYKKYGFVDFFMPMLKNYVGTSTYETPLLKAFDYEEGKTKVAAPLAMATLFLPVMKQALGNKEKTLENITAQWDELEQSSGQKVRFEVDDYSNVRTDMLNIFYVYFSLTGNSLSAEALESLKSNASYTSGALLVEAYQ